METIKQIIKNFNNEKLVCEVNLPSVVDNKLPVVIILHAITGKKENRTINYLAKNLPESGYITLQFDFSGHGESEGKLSESTISKQLEDIKLVIKDIKNVDFTRIVLIGNSFSVITALAFAKNNENVKGIIMLGGRAKYMDYINNLEKINGKYRLFENEFIDEDFVKDYKKYNPLNIIENLTIPTLIVQGENDEIIPVTDAKLFYEKSPAKIKSLKIIKGSDHRFSDIKFKVKILDEIKEFLDRVK
jgi:esterase/lipase